MIMSRREAYQSRRFTVASENDASERASSATRRSSLSSTNISNHILLLSSLTMFTSLTALAQMDSPNLGDKINTVVTPSSNDAEPEQCEWCSLVVNSFEKGLERTMRGKHEGGDTSWEEKHLKSYADSEVRLVEIQEDLCNDLTSSKAQCLAMAENGESVIEEWWFKHRNNNVKLHDFLCIDKLKKCCPENSFGGKCQECQVCGKHGKCDGSGTRSGSGKCNCYQGYIGKLCDDCDEGYYSSQFDGDDGFECLECHRSCLGGCSGPTSSNCTECAAGYTRDPQTNICIDINECELNGPDVMQLDAKSLCKDGTYCVNTDGHYKCSNCHHNCKTCLGYGPDKCLTCAPSHFMDKNHTCLHFTENKTQFEIWSLLLIISMTVSVIYVLITRLVFWVLRYNGITIMEGSFIHKLLGVLPMISGFLCGRYIDYCVIEDIISRNYPTLICYFKNLLGYGLNDADEDDGASDLSEARLASDSYLNEHVGPNLHQEF